MIGGLLSPQLMGAPQQMMPRPPQANAMQQPGLPVAQAPGAGTMQSIGDRFLQFAQSNPGALGALGAGLMAGQPAQGMAAMSQITAEGKKKNQTLEFLRKNNPEIAGMVEAGMPVSDAFQLFVSQRKAQKGDDTRYGLNPIWGTDDQGNPVLGTMGTDGSFKRVDTGGFNLSTGVDRVDLGTHWGLIDKRSGQMVGSLPKENYQEAYDTAQGGAEGKIRGEAIANAPGELMAASRTVTLIDELIDHPGLDSIVGSIDQYRSGMALPPEGRDALTRFNQLKGRAFLEAYSMLKGGGQITEIEGLKAEQAMARMDRAQGEAEFRAALKDFRDAVAAGAEKLRNQTGVQGGPSIQPQASPQPGGGSGGYRILGVE